MPFMADEDHVDRFLDDVEPLAGVGIDLEVEGIVDRIGGISRRIKRGMEATLAEYGLTHPGLAGAVVAAPAQAGHRSTPGVLAADLELSTGAMTSRLDRLERSRPHPARCRSPTTVAASWSS